jgi:uncharacterized protein (DUF983 family)
MTAITLRVLCANCGGDERLSRLVAGTAACPWCGLSFADDLARAGASRPVFLSVVLIEELVTSTDAEAVAQ